MKVERRALINPTTGQSDSDLQDTQRPTESLQEDTVPGLSLMVFTLVRGATLCGFAALVLLVISTATDHWMQYRYSGNAANQGLWRFCINRKCHAHTLNVAFWDATRAFMLLSVLSCFSGVVLGAIASERPSSRRVKTGGVALLLSGFLSILALAIYTGMTVNFFGKRYIDWRFSWSYIVGWIGIILALGAGVLQLRAHQRSMSEPVPASVSDT